MAKDPAFLFYSGDFLTGVTGMSMEERGQYITLLCLQHAKGHLTLELMNRTVTGLSSYVLEKFQQDEDGLYFNQRLEQEAIKRNKFCKSRSENRIKKDSSEKDMFNICETNVLHMENENVSINNIDLSSNEINKGVAKIENNLPAKRTRKVSKAWDESDPEGMINLPGEDKRKLPENQFLQILKWQGKKPQPGNELVWLSDIEFEELVIRAGDRNIALKAIENLHEHKQENQGVRTYSDDSRKVMGWALDKARKSAKIAGYDPNKERIKQKKLGENMNLFINQNPQE